MDDEVFTVKEVAEMFKVSTSTIYARVSGWPHIRITPTDIRFSREDIEADQGNVPQDSAGTRFAGTEHADWDGEAEGQEPGVQPQERPQRAQLRSGGPPRLGTGRATYRCRRRRRSGAGSKDYTHR
jgi:hypothetical protein